MLLNSLWFVHLPVTSCVFLYRLKSCNYSLLWNIKLFCFAHKLLLIPKLTYLLCLDTVASSLCFLFRNPLHYYKPLCPYDCISTLYLAVRPLGTLPLTPARRFPRSIWMPEQCSCHLYAVHRITSNSSRYAYPRLTTDPLVLMESLRFRRFRKWFTASFISTVHTWLFCTAFSLTLSTIAFDYSTSEWFETSTYIAVPMGLPSSFTQHGYTCLTSCHKFPPSWRTIISIDHQTCISL